MTLVISSTVSGRNSDSWNSGGTDVNDGDGSSMVEALTPPPLPKKLMKRLSTDVMRRRNIFATNQGMIDLHSCWGRESSDSTFPAREIRASDYAGHGELGV